MSIAKCAAVLVALAAAAAADDAAGPKQRLIPVPGRIVQAVVQTPGKSSSQVLQRSAGRLDKAFDVTSRVIVHGDFARVARLVGASGRVKPAPAKGFVIVQTATVDDAITIAQRLMNDPKLSSIELDLDQPKSDRIPSDPAFPGQWSLYNLSIPAADVNVVPVWDAGITGAGVTVGVIEFTWQRDHPDLAANFVAAASMPSTFVSDHATSVAGIIAADNDNGRGGVGVAYDAGISSQIYGTSSDNADAFLFRNDLNDIKNNSWGPFDNGRLSDIAAIERAALAQGVAEGRGGLGEIYVWAAGNGGLDDRVDYDPYASSRYTIAIGAVGDLNTRADYNELGASMFAVAHSSGNVRNIFSTTSGSSYTTSFGGTSAASPLAAGVIALMLEANPTLTWRDVQHIIADTAWKIDPGDEGWYVNSDGRNVNDSYGFGAIDAEAAVAAAQSWTNVGPEVVADTGIIPVNATLPDNDFSGITIGLPMAANIRLESVELVLNVDTAFVGDLSIEMRSPTGTRSTLATTRVDPTHDLIDRTFTSLRHWGEASAGTWTVTIADQRATNIAHWIDARIIGYGTAIDSGCTADFNSDGSTDIFDVQAFLAAFSAHNPRADLQPDSLFDFYDVQTFLNLFSQGCP